MSNRKIINAAATGGIGYYPVVGASDPYYDKVSLLLNGDTDVDTNFANVSLLLTGNDLLDKSNIRSSITNTGSVTTSSVNKKFGTGSMYFNGTSSYLSIPYSNAFNFSGGTFTFECWIYQIANGGTGHYILDQRNFPTGTGFSINGGIPTLMYAGMNEAKGTTAIPLNIWTHVAISVLSGTARIYINGVQTFYGTGYTFPDLSSSSTPLWVGAPNSYGVFLNAYIDDLRITKGVARYTSNFTPPTQALPSHEILDNSVYRLPVTTYGNARIDNATKKYGTGAMYFDGTGDYLTLLPNINLAFPADFTIELWFNSSSFAAQRTLISTAGYYVAGNNGNWTFRVTGASSIAFAQYNSQSMAGGGWEFPVPAMSTGTWYHVAVTRSNGTISLYLNGTASSTTYLNSSNISDGSVSNVYVGRNVSYDNDWIGYIDDLRITKGYARYTANFTPPTAALPTTPPTIAADPWWGNVSLLLDGNTTDAYDPYWQNVSLMLTGDDLIDWSNQHNAITVVGNTSINTTTKKFGTGSMYFDGSGDYLNLTYSKTNFDWWTSDFTLECWVNPTTLSSFDYYAASYNVHVSNLIGNASASSAYANWLFGPIGDGRVAFYYYNGTVVTPTNSTATISAGTWSHIALTKTSAGFQIWVNGVGNGYTAISGTPQAGTDAAFIVGNCQGYCINGYVDDLRITKGVARYTANFTPPIAALPAYKIQDRTQNNLTVTPYGNVQLSTDVKKNGTGSMFFDGTGDYLTLPTSPNFSFGTGDFTIEMWVNPSSVAATIRGLFAVSGGAGAGIPKFVVHLNSGTPSIHYNGLTNGSNIYTTSTSAISANIWTHLAFVRTSGTWTWYVNGVASGTGSNSTDITFTSQPAYAGYGGESYFDGFNGYIDDLRITKGYARYTQNFTPPSQSFATQYISTGFDANYADVSLLLTGEGTNGSQVFTDLSSSPKTITAYGDAKISTTVKQYGTGAMYFDGTGDYLSIQSTADIEFGSGDFTIEFWWYPTSTARQALYHGSFGADYSIGIDYSSVSTNQKIGVWVSSNGTSWNLINSDLGGNGIGTISITQNAWNHIVFVRSGTTWQLYINGVRDLNLTAISGSIVSRLAYPKVIGNWWTNAAMSQVYGYIDDLRITKGIARYTTNFTPPTYALATTTGTPFDVNRSSTSLLLRGNGTNGSTSFTDESPNNLTVTNNGSVTVNTSVKKYGTGSMAFSGSNYLSLSSSSIFNFGTTDFTLEGWFYKTTTGNVPGIVGNNSAWAANAWGLVANHPSYPNKLTLFVNNMSTTQGVVVSSTTLSLNTWYHFAVTRVGSTIKLFLNGILESTGTSTAAINSSNDVIALGNNYGDYLSGYIDDFRITKGYARYTANFTPPTYEDPIVTGTQYDYNYAQVSLLLNGDGTNGSQVFTDLSSSPKTITTYGNAQISTSTKKFGTGAMYFDGTGDYFTIASNNAFNFGTNDFTIECWYYHVSKTTAAPQLIGNNLSWGTNCWQIAVSHDGAPGKFSLYCYNMSTSAAALTSTTSLVINTMYHFALVRNGNTIKMYINGNLEATATNTIALSNADDSLIVGNTPANNGSINGYIDDFRITKGLARYTQNFTPPTAPLPTSGGY